MIRPLILVLLLLARPACAAESSPAAAALSFLESLRVMPAENPPAPDKITAMHPQTTQEKSSEISRVLSSLAASIKNGGALSVAEQKIDGDLAAVIIHDSPLLDPASARVHAVTLIRKDSKWIPAPLPGSFENLGIDYSPAPAAAARRLGVWLDSRLPEQLARLRKDTVTQTRRRLLDAIPAGLADEMKPQAWLAAFLDAAESRDLAGVMATIGGLENPQPHGWLESIPRIRNILDNTPAKTTYDSPPPFPTWATIASSPGPRACLDWTIEETTASARLFELYTPLCRRLNRDEPPPVYFSSYQLRLGDHWRVVLDTSSDIPLPPPLELAATDDSDRFLRALAAAHPIPPPAGSAEVAALAVRSLGLDHPGPLLACVASRPDVRPAIWGRLLRLWARTSETARPPLLLDVQTDGPTATVAWCLPELRFPLIPQSQISFLRLVRSGDIWSLDPTDPTDTPTRGKAAAWAENCLKIDTSAWFRKLGLDDTLAGLPPGPGPTEADALTAITAWATAVTADDLPGILRHSVVFNDIKGIETLAGVIAAELPSTRGLEIIGIHRQDRWAAATVRYPGPPGQASDYLLIPLLQVGPQTKVLGEITLFEPDSRPRRYLNDRAWKRLESRLPAAAVTELRDLLDAHCKLAETHRGQQE